MNEQTEKLIHSLADKLGVSIEHLWEVLIKQARIEAWTDLYGVGVFLVLGIVWTLWLGIMTFKNDPTPDEESVSFPLWLITVFPTHVGMDR